MILSAGLGTRLRPITEKFAKPAVPFLNIPLLYYPLNLLAEAGVDSLVFNTHHLPHQIGELGKKIPGGGFDVAFSHEPGSPLGSGGGIWGARLHLEGSGDFLVSNGDEVILPREPGVMARFLEEHRRHRALASILVMHHPLVGTQFGGVWADSQMMVRGFGKDGSKFGSIGHDVSGFHYIGLLLLNDRIFSYLPEGESNILYDALAAGIAKGETVRAVSGSFTWFETGNPKDFLHATGEAIALARGPESTDATYLRDICEKFWAPGTRWEDRDGASVLVGKGATLSSQAKIRGFTVLGDGSRVDGASEIARSVVLPGANVDGSRLIHDEIVLP